MFRTAISSSPLTTDIANRMMSKISGETFRGDISLLTTMRALFFDRVPDGETIYIKHGASSSPGIDPMAIASGSVTDITAEGISYLMGGYSPAYGSDRGILYINNVSDIDGDRRRGALRIIKEGFESVFDGYHSVDIVSKFFEKNFEVLCFVNETLKNTVVFVDMINMKKYHALQCALIKMFPWYFGPGDQLSDEDKALIYSFREHTEEKYVEAIANIARRYDFETERIRMLLAGFESCYERNKISSIEQEIESLRQSIEDHNNWIRTNLATLRDKNTMLLGLNERIKASEGSTELLDYFLSNKHLHLENVSGSEMTFIVSGYLSYFDEDMASRSINNHRSYVYEYNEVISDEQMKKLMRACFVYQTIKIRVCAAFRLTIGLSVESISKYNSYGEIGKTHMANPHLNRYSCLGDNEALINEYLRDGDCIMAIEQSIAAAESLNWGDGAVISEFFKSLNECSDYWHNNRCFELPDGTVVDPVGAVNWIESEEMKAMEDNTVE